MKDEDRRQMKDVTDITVTQIRLYPTDLLPFAELRLATNTKVVKEAFHFESVQAGPLAGQVTFNNGVFEEKGESIQVLTLTVEPRRVTAQVRGGSPLADRFHSALSGLLGSFRKRPTGALKPLLKAEETACVATLGIDFDELIAPSLLHFIKAQAAPKLGTDYGTPRSISFRSLAFEIKYAPTKPELEDHDVTLSNKAITIEPRLGTPPRERRFFTSSPTDSETHMALLEALEREVVRARQKKRQRAR